MPPLSRRFFLRRSAAVAAGLTVPGVLVACGSGDADVFAQIETSASTAAPGPTAPPTNSGEAAVVESSAPEPTAVFESAGESTGESAGESTGETARESTGETAAPTVAAAGPVSLAVDFTYTMASGGKQLNPYVGVWIESTDGTLLRTVALWYEQTEKGPRWLNDLTQWWRRDQSRLSAGGGEIAAVISSATRTPGSYSVLWDGLDESGQPVLDPTVVLCIESARERGPYSLICEQISPADMAARVSLTNDGELSGASVVRA